MRGARYLDWAVNEVSAYYHEPFWAYDEVAEIDIYREAERIALGKEMAKRNTPGRKPTAGHPAGFELEPIEEE